MIKIIIIANLQSRKDRMNGKYIKEIADRKDMSIYRLEKESGVSAGRIWRIIKGETKNPSIDNLIQIADALDVTLDELVGRLESWNLTQGICIACAWMIKNHNEEAMVVDMLASMHITKEMMQRKHVAEEDYKILSEAIDSNCGRNGNQLQQK